MGNTFYSTQPSQTVNANKYLFFGLIFNINTTISRKVVDVRISS